MKEWSADITNNPDDDFNLVIEILHQGKDVAVIAREGTELSIKFHPHSESLSIPVDWLNGLLTQTLKDLGRK